MYSLRKSVNIERRFAINCLAASSSWFIHQYLRGKYYQFDHLHPSWMLKSLNVMPVNCKWYVRVQQYLRVFAYGEQMMDHVITLTNIQQLHYKTISIHIKWMKSPSFTLHVRGKVVSVGMVNMESLLPNNSYVKCVRAFYQHRLILCVCNKTTSWLNQTVAMNRK